MTSIFVGNLPYGACEIDLQRLFERYGRVASARIMTDPATNRSRGFGFVHMPSLDDADEAIKRLTGVSLSGRYLTINESRSDRHDRVSNARDGSARSSALQMFDQLCGE